MTLINVLAEYFAKLNNDDNTYEEYEVQRSVDKSDFQNKFLNVPFHDDEIMSVYKIREISWPLII